MFALAGCDNSSTGAAVNVTLVTTFAPAVDFDSVQVELRQGVGDAGANASRVRTYRPLAQDPVETGVSVATFPDVPTGAYSVTVTLFLEKRTIASKTVTEAIRKDVDLRVEVARTCTRTERNCGDDVDDDCDGFTDCGDDDCTLAICATKCTEFGVCSASGACVEGQDRNCNDNNGCTADSCDALLGCVNTPVEGTCDDMDACTDGDACAAGQCVGQPRNCDDSNGCTDDSCDSTSGCKYDFLDKDCDDGSWCTGVDKCDPATGTCSIHPAPNCVNQPCNDTLMACAECNVDAECGAPTATEWSPCGGFVDGNCDPSGVQYRTVTTHTCTGNHCIHSETVQSQACTRAVPGENGDCGFGGRFRCCNEACVDTFSNFFHCGGCNFFCDGAQHCEVTTKGVPACRCSTTQQCKGGICRAGQASDNYFCDCDSNAQCPGGKTCFVETGLDVCR